MFGERSIVRTGRGRVAFFVEEDGNKRTMNHDTTLMSSIESALSELDKLDYTENGALGYKSTGHALLDLNFRAASYRDADPQNIIEDFAHAYAEDKLLALKWLFFARDVRGGMGERRLFRIILGYLAVTCPELVRKLIPLVAEFGRYDDLLLLLDTSCAEDTIRYIGERLADDTKNMQEGQPVSLLAKWLPSINTSSKEARRLGRKIAAGLNLSEKGYRKLLSPLRKYIDVVECKMSKREWSTIEYPHVPSRASLLYRNAFSRHDAERYNAYIESVRKGEAKINADVLFPHDIVCRYRGEVWGDPLRELDPVLEALWDNLPNTAEEGQRILVVRDGSGSMSVPFGSSAISALDCSTALAVYFAERMHGEFKGKFITFSRHPALIDLSDCQSLHDKLKRAYSEDDCSNTDIHAVFRLILKSAVANHLSQDALPTAILILSDMEFDGHRFVWDRALFDTISAEYEAQGYKLPRLVFWNLNSRTRVVPMTQNDLGVTLISGFSPHLAKMVMSAQLDPYRALVEILQSPRYSPLDSLFP